MFFSFSCDCAVVGDIKLVVLEITDCELTHIFGHRIGGIEVRSCRVLKEGVNLAVNKLPVAVNPCHQQGSVASLTGSAHSYRGKIAKAVSNQVIVI